MEQSTPQKTNGQHQKRFWKANLTVRTFNEVTETTWNLPHQRKRHFSEQIGFCTHKLTERSCNQKQIFGCPALSP
ncbi:hypothetical protein, partial [Vibrio parahaemolyticus]|uniref:hypothetical protein n=1 Tax=Vibrio parahaemolyticus TaxID=670 RepID=UPI001C5D6497